MHRWVGLVAVASVAVLMTGCPTKKKTGPLDGETGSGVDEESLGEGVGSLDLAKQGKLGQGGAGGDTGPLRDVHFEYDSFDLDDSARQTLQGNADWLTDHADVRVEIEGHCDDRGTVEYNLALGAKRAAAVKSYLVALGVARERMTTISYGEELPVCHEETESCWSSNRRAHFVQAAN